MEVHLSNCSKLMINGEFHKMEISGVTDDPEVDGRTYKTTFTTMGFEQCKSGKRKEVLIVFEVCLCWSHSDVIVMIL